MMNIMEAIGGLNITKSTSDRLSQLCLILEAARSTRWIDDSVVTT